MASDGPPFWIYILIPIVSGLVGYLTNVLALWMTFYPIEFLPWKLWQPAEQPFGLFGWQGIIPSKAAKMARILCNTMTTKLLDIPEIFSRIDPGHVAQLLAPEMQSTTQLILDKVAKAEAPTVWMAISQHVKDELVGVMESDAQEFVSMMLDTLKSRVLEVLDLENLIVEKVKADKSIVVNMFQKVGATEFVFLKNSGFVFGLLLGLVQAGIYAFYRGVWVLPVAGFIVGYITNSIALKLIFSPARPVNLGFFTFQGMFLKRQTEVSYLLSEMAKDYFIQQADLWDEVYHGRYKSTWDEMVGDVTNRFLRQQACKDVSRRMASAMLLGEDGITRIRTLVATTIDKELPILITGAYSYMDKVMNVEVTMRTELLALPSEDFVGILRPVFQEDEIKLIVVGGVLGALAGCLQQFLLFPYIV